MKQLSILLQRNVINNKHLNSEQTGHFIYEINSSPGQNKVTTREKCGLGQGSGGEVQGY